MTIAAVGVARLGYLFATARATPSIAVAVHVGMAAGRAGRGGGVGFAWHGAKGVKSKPRKAGDVDYSVVARVFSMPAYILS